MKFIKQLWQHKNTRIWMLVTIPILVLLLIATIIMTQVSLVYNTINIVLGGERAIVEEDAETNYEADYASKTDVLSSANEFVTTVCEEGFTLLKNEDQALPLDSGAKVTVFGKNSVNLVYGGSGSSASGSDDGQIDLYRSLSDAGFVYNTTMKAFYESSASGSGREANPDMGDILYGFSTGETPVSSYTQEVRESYQDYPDAAIVVISRIGGEGYDLPRTMRTDADENSVAVEGARSADDHYLQLDQNETDMLEEACDNFDTVIVVLNTASTFELGFLDDESNYAYHDNIKAAIWTGLPGNTGMEALGSILNGDVNPSGRTADTYARNFKDDPSWYNFGNNMIENGNRYIKASDGKNSPYYFVDYEEGIYVGYRYYETRGYTESEADPESTWYQDNVVYPFGYGLSYTTFDWEVVNEDELIDTALTEDSVLDIEVEVTNTGDRAGKDVVELYVTAPYTEGEIEKAYVVLSAFEKTSLLEPGESEVVTLKFDPYTAASYDFTDANNNGFIGYELDPGTYTLKIASDSHTVNTEINTTVEGDGIQYRTSVTEDGNNSNLFDDVSSKFIDSDDGVLTLSRQNNFENFSILQAPTTEERTVSDEFLDSLNFTVTDEESDPWYSDEMPVTGEPVTLDFSEMAGKEYDDPLWDEFMDQLTLEQMANLIGYGAFTTGAISEVGVPMTNDSDGASGFTNFMSVSEGLSTYYDTCFYQSETVLSSTWNKELAHEMGEMIGNESLIGNERGDGLPYTGWYAPATNIHRSQFGGRNWEYYSEDGYLAGMMASETVSGAREKGVITYVKHFAVNDQETNRDSNGYCTWLTEQSMREIYLKPFEYAVKEGGTTGIMTSFNRIGTTWAGGSYALLTQLLRNEWGFNGVVITDYAVNGYMKTEQSIRAGGSLMLSQLGDKIPEYTSISSTQATAIRNASKDILYAVSRSNAMDAPISGYMMPIWEIVLISADIAVAIGLIIWGVFCINSNRKKSKQISGEL